MISQGHIDHSNRTTVELERPARGNHPHLGITPSFQRENKEPRESFFAFPKNFDAFCKLKCYSISLSKFSQKPVKIIVLRGPPNRSDVRHYLDLVASPLDALLLSGFTALCGEEDCPLFSVSIAAHYFMRARCKSHHARWIQH